MKTETEKQLKKWRKEIKVMLKHDALTEEERDIVLKKREEYKQEATYIKNLRKKTFTSSDTSSFLPFKIVQSIYPLCYRKLFLP